MSGLIARCRRNLRPVALTPVPLFYMRIMQVLGLFPISVKSIEHAALPYNAHNSATSKCTPGLCVPLLWSCVQMFLLTVLHTFTSYNYKQIIYNGDIIGKFNDILKLWSAIIAYSVSLIECLWRRQELCDFFDIYMRLQYAARPARGGLWADQRRLHIYFTIGLAVMLLTELSYTWEVRQRDEWLIFFLGFMPSVTICRLRLMQYVCYLEFLRMEIAHCDACVRKLQHLPPNELYTELRRLMCDYTKLFQMSNLLRKSTALSLVSIYVTSYIKLLSDCYWTYYVVYSGDDVMESVLILSTIVNITLLLVSSHNCMRTVDTLSHNVHKIRVPIEELQLAKRHQNFVLLLRHQPIVYDAYGFFVVNCTLISAMMASITTYMIFFVQFMPKFKNL